MPPRPALGVGKVRVLGDVQPRKILCGPTLVQQRWQRGDAHPPWVLLHADAASPSFTSRCPKWVPKLPARA